MSSDNLLVYCDEAGSLEHSVTSVTLVNNVAKTVDTTVPSTVERWLLKTIKITNIDNVNRTVTVTVWKESGKTNKLYVLTSGTVVATTGELVFPNGVTGTATFIGLPYDLILEGGNTIEVVWAAGGASAGGTDADGLVISYLRRAKS